ncbi:MAG: response regulator [Synechocystis sp.]|nr:response regulator [Synechocystis sp.]
MDDDAITRSLLILSLKKEGYHVEEATNGAECLQKYPRIQPNLVLLDALMPEMDGFDCCRALRQLAAFDVLPILMITFLDDNESIDKAFSAGATDYIPKPIHWGSLRQRVKTSLQSGHLAQLYVQQQSWQTLVRQWLALLTTKADRQDFTVVWHQFLSQLPPGERAMVKTQGWGNLGVDQTLNQVGDYNLDPETQAKLYELGHLVTLYREYITGEPLE